MGRLSRRRHGTRHKAEVKARPVVEAPAAVEAAVPGLFLGEPVVAPDDGCGMTVTITPIYGSGPAVSPSARDELLRQYAQGLGCHEHDVGADGAR